MELLENVWAKGKESIHRERQELEKYMSSQHETAERGAIEPWDWRFYAEKVRQSQYNIDANEVKQYFSWDHMMEAIFDVANKLFGLTFIAKPDLTAYHPDCKVYEVREGDRLVALFLSDNYARQYKRSGAWMSKFHLQHKNTAHGESVVPIVVNNNNFNRGSVDVITGKETTLLSYDDARTLFHEFGHGLHGMLSDVTYSRLAGTSVLRDFVELPSQLYEHWLGQKEVLRKHAVHYITGQVIPDELLSKMKAAQRFGQGFATIEYTASALVDIALHRTTEGVSTLDIGQFEREELKRLGMPQGMAMRHRPAHFQHLFSGSSYASAYYVYLWAEVLDADGFDAFLETGDCFDSATAARVRKYIYSSGNSIDPAEAFRLFRGRDPAIEPMLKKKGLMQ
jgi:peptidyl-dipeptidase Dcp